MIIEEFIPRKWLNRGYVIIAGWMIVGTVAFGLWPWLRQNDTFRDVEYHSRIDSIEYRPGHHGSPHVKLIDGWYLLSAEELKISGHILVGDSIIKEQGSATITVFRRSSSGALESKKF